MTPIGPDLLSGGSGAYSDPQENLPLWVSRQQPPDEVCSTDLEIQKRGPGMTQFQRHMTFPLRGGLEVHSPALGSVSSVVLAKKEPGVGVRPLALVPREGPNGSSRGKLLVASAAGGFCSHHAYEASLRIQFLLASTTKRLQLKETRVS